MRGQQHLGGGRLEGDPALGADDGVAQVNAAADAEGSGERFELLDDRRPRTAARRRDCPGLPASNPMVWRSRRRGCVKASLDSTQASSGMLPCRGQGFLAADGDAPQAAIHRIGRAERRNRQAVLFEIFELFRPLERAVAHRRDDLEIRRQRAQRHFEAHLIVARGGAAVRDHLGFERQRHLRDGLRLQHALGADAQRIDIAAADVAHDQEFQHLIEIRRSVRRSDDARSRPAAPNARPATAPPRHRCRRCRRSP